MGKIKQLAIDAIEIVGAIPGYVLTVYVWSKFRRESFA